MRVTNRQIYAFSANGKNVQWSHIGKVVSAVLLAAAAVVGIVAWLTTLVGFVIAVAGIGLLILGALVVAVVTRPDRKPSKSIRPPELSPAPISQRPKEEEPKSKPPALKPKPEMPEPEKRRIAIPYIPKAMPVPESVASSGSLVEAYRRGKSQAQAAPIPTPSTKPPQAKPSFKEEHMARKRLEVAAGAVTTQKLALVKGDTFYGRLREVDGYEFTWAIVDLKNLGLMERKMRFIAQQGEWDVPTATVEWTVPSDGPWFLAFDASGKQYVREVAVELWRRIPE